jgi:electron-transferring-flavoprotein dehydrogenase
VDIGRAADMYPQPDNELTFNKLDSVFLSGNATRDDACTRRRRGKAPQAARSARAACDGVS